MAIETITLDQFDGTDVVYSEVVTDESVKGGYREFRSANSTPQAPTLIRVSHKLAPAGLAGVDRHRIYIAKTLQDTVLGTFHTMSVTFELVCPHSGGFTSTHAKDLGRYLSGLSIGATMAGTNMATLFSSQTPVGDFSD